MDTPNLSGVAIGALSGLPGWAALFRAIGQNRNEQHSTLTSEQTEFRRDLLTRIQQVEQTNTTLLAMVQAQALQMAAITVERDALKERVDELEDQLRELQHPAASLVTITGVGIRDAVSVEK